MYFYQKLMLIGTIVDSGHQVSTTKDLMVVVMFGQMAEALELRPGYSGDWSSGSGSTGLSCKNTNRNYLMIEKKPKYFNIIKERLNEE